jgi:hypothetical protein
VAPGGAGLAEPGRGEGAHGSGRRRPSRARPRRGSARLSRRPRRPTSRRPPSTPRPLRSPPRRASSCKSAPPARGLRGSFSRSGPLSPTPGRHSSGSIPLARRHRSRWRSGTLSSRSSRANWWLSASRVRTRSSPSRSRAPPSSACSRRSRPSAAPSRWRGSRLKVGCCSISCFTDLPFEDSFPLLISFLLVTLRPAHHAGTRD